MSEGYLLAIPVFNEERHVRRVIDEARRYVDEILVVDDGSTDRTPELLRRGPTLHVIRHAENRGYGKSLTDAFAFAQRHRFAWLITMDCDEQHEPSYIPRFVAAAKGDEVDLISGTRYPNGPALETGDPGGPEGATGSRSEGRGAPPDRRAINRHLTAVLNRRLGLNLTDAFCGFKAYRVAPLEALNITVPGYAMPIQLWVQAARAGLRIRELPVPLIYHDPARHFGGVLDNPSVRLNHYLNVLEAELATTPIESRRIGA